MKTLKSSIEQILPNEQIIREQPIQEINFFSPIFQTSGIDRKVTKGSLFIETLQYYFVDSRTNKNNWSWSLIILVLIFAPILLLMLSQTSTDPVQEVMKYLVIIIIIAVIVGAIITFKHTALNSIAINKEWITYFNETDTEIEIKLKTPHKGLPYWAIELKNSPAYAQLKGFDKLSATIDGTFYRRYNTEYRIVIKK